MSVSAKDFPIRAVGGNVLLRRVQNADAHSFLTLVFAKNDHVLQIGEIVGLGSRWTQDMPWSPPMPEQNKQRAEQLEREGIKRIGENYALSEWKPMWKYPDSSTPRRPIPRFGRGHEMATRDIQVGDLVVYNRARVYDHFSFQGDNILVYPGNWIYGVVEKAYLTEKPETREYDTVADV